MLLSADGSMLSVEYIAISGSNMVLWYRIGDSTNKGVKHDTTLADKPPVHDTKEITLWENGISISVRV